MAFLGDVRAVRERPVWPKVLGHMPLLQLMMERPKAAALGTAGVMLLALKPLWRWWREPQVDRFQKVPGLGFFGLFFQILPVLPYPLNPWYFQKMEEFSRKYGDEGVYEMEVFGRREIVCCSWEMAQQVFENHPFRVIRGTLEDFHAKRAPIGIVIADGKQWQQERRFMHPFFSEKAMAENRLKIERAVEQTVSRFVSESLKGGAVSCFRVLELSLAQLLSDVVVGEELPEGSEEFPPWWHCWEKLFHISLLNYEFPFFRSALEAAKAKAIEACMAAGPPGDGTFFGRLRSLALEGRISSDRISGFIISFCLAGGHSPAIILSWSFYHLAQLPDVQETIFEEITKGKKPVWVEALFLETIRLYAFEIHQFQTAEEIMLAGRKVPPGTFLRVHMRHLLRNFKEPKLGEDLHEFRPGRWVGPDGIIQAPPYNDLLWGHRGRECLGRRMVLSFAPMVIAKVVERFILTPCGSEDVIFSDKLPVPLGTPEPKHANVQFNPRSLKPRLDHHEGCGDISNTASTNSFNDANVGK